MTIKMKRLLFILVLFTSTCGYSQGLKALLMSQTTADVEYIASSFTATTASNSSPVYVYYPPSYIEAKNVFILIVSQKIDASDGFATFTTPSGWTLLDSTSKIPTSSPGPLFSRH